MTAAHSKMTRIAGLLGLTVVAGSMLLGRFVSDAWRPYAPAPAWVRAMLGVIWCAAQGSMIASAYLHSHRAFGTIVTAGLLAGLTIMTIGRSALSASAWLLLAMLLPIIVLLGGAAIRLSRLTEATGPTREVRLLLVLSATGVVYLFSTRVADGLAQLAAVGAVSAILAFLAASRQALSRAIDFLEARDRRRFVAVLWATAFGLLVLNIVAKLALGVITPQIGLPIAPYQLAAVLILIAVVVIRHSLAPLGRPEIGFHLAAFIVCAIAMAAVDFGTLAMVFVGVALMLSVGSVWRLAAAIMLAAAVLYGASGPLAPSVLRVLPTRAAVRIATWAGLGTPNDQLVRVRETIALAGLTGQAGAARTNFLIGSQAAKDYAAAVLAAQGGVAGLLMVFAGLLLFLFELFRRAYRAEGAVSKALCTGVFGLFAANALIAVLWMNETVPLIGIPAPLFARAGSHLTVAAFVIGLGAFGMRGRCDVER